MRALVLLLAPTAPHIAEELWHRLGYEESVHLQSWPEWSEELAAEETVTLVLQINGKVRERMEVPAGISETEAVEIAWSNPRLHNYLDGKRIVKQIFVPDRLLNFVVR